MQMFLEKLTNPDLYTAIAQLAWPLVVLIIFFKGRELLTKLVQKEEINIEVAGQKVSIKSATSAIGKSVAEIQERVALIENSIDKKNNLTIAKSNAKVDSDYFHILWVDDYPSNNAFMIDHFRKNNIGVTLSISTSEALDYLKKGNYNVIISDLGRQENGVENPFAGRDLLNQMRAEGIEVPTIIFAGARGLEYKASLLKAGAKEVTSSAVDVVKFVENHRT